MTMDGLDANAVTASEITAIKVGLASIMTGVSESHITSVTVADASTRYM